MTKRATLGPYQLGPQVGSGGMAEVFVARDPRADAKEPIVAVKVIKRELIEKDSYFADLFFDEAHILSRLSHPNLIRVLDATVAEGEYYIAMELLLGRTLADSFDVLAEKGERIPDTAAAEVCRRVAEGLHYAHELTDEEGASYELVHRDVNPSNIYVTTDGTVKVIDFGLARTRGARAKSLTGVAKGKVTYLAPEQLTPRSADRRIDIYQLGITFWELLTGKRLFVRETPVETLRAIQNNEVPRPEEIVPDVDRAFAAIAMRALEPDPDRRFTTMAAFARALSKELERRSSRRPVTDILDSAFPGERAKTDQWYEENLERAMSLPPPSTRSISDAIAGARAERNDASGPPEPKVRIIRATPPPPPMPSYMPSAPSPKSPVEGADKSLTAPVFPKPGKIPEDVRSSVAKSDKKSGLGHPRGLAALPVPPWAIAIGAVAFALVIWMLAR